ncbi:NAD(P)-binding protein [Prochlorococcus marinus]|uniref:NAD(P)-binding protein n=1 Tax=Prochlorococcus marinus TaxID=1219 RepID=UPI0022B4F7AD|nr:FAD/NAD(P)-binding protein [Prochlorococcus marinus]
MNKIYDCIVIGAGISACTFASFLNQRFSDASILLIEQGRRLGGRSTTRKSRKNKILEFDHGLPSISFSKHISKDILTLISPLISSKKMVDISKDILIMNEFGILKNVFTNDKIYRSVPFMKNFCEEIVNQSMNPKKINFLFQTLAKSIKRINDLWEIQVDNGKIIKSINLVLSSSLIAHPRCLEILMTNTLPLRDAFIPGKDKVVDSVLREIRKLTYIKRKIYILYVSNLELVKNFNQQYLQIIFSNVIREDLSFERIIFQRQSDGSLIILLHCYYINNLLEINIDKIIKSLSSLFLNYQMFVDLFLQARLIDKMDWRASQPLNHLLPKELQWSSSSRIGFCGDWFDFNSCGGVESAMNSSIRLAKMIN